MEKPTAPARPGGKRPSRPDATDTFVDGPVKRPLARTDDSIMPPSDDEAADFLLDKEGADPPAAPETDDKEDATEVRGVVPPAPESAPQPKTEVILSEQIDATRPSTVSAKAMARAAAAAARVAGAGGAEGAAAGAAPGAGPAPTP